MTWGPDRWRLYKLGLREAGRAVRGRVASSLFRLRGRTPQPGRLLFAPHDLRTSDPTVASDIYAGFFVFAGRALSTGGRSPFDFVPPTRAWGEGLYGFGWLRHLRAAGTALSQANARALVDEFISQGRGDRMLARETPVLARRLISFLSQSPLVLEGADHAFYRRFLRAIGRGARDLERSLIADPLPYRRLMAAVALCYAGLCCEGLERALKRGTRVLSVELEEQILPDGGHVSRNPRVVIELLFDLLPLRQMFASRGLETPEALLRAIDRLLPMLRMLRHPDGTLSHFNGMGVTAPDQVATLLMYDETLSRPMQHAPHSGYERVMAGNTLLVADVGAAPPVDHSSEASAGCLSFELTSGAQRIIVNCGTPRQANDLVAQAARSTAAHSTASVANMSSARIVAPQGWWLERRLAQWIVRRLGPVLLTGPSEVPASRTEQDGSFVLRASHDGYRSRFGLTHERHWRLSPGGERLEGEDLVHLDPGRRAPGDVTVRFHLAPGVKSDRPAAARDIRLTLPNQETWRFSASPGEAALEDSVFFAAMDGFRRTEQIVISLPADTAPLRWSFEREASAAAAPPASPAEEAPETAMPREDVGPSGPAPESAPEPRPDAPLSDTAPEAPKPENEGPVSP